MESAELEYYGEYCLSTSDGHDEDQEFFNDKESCYDRLQEYIDGGELYDIHILIFNPEYGYEVIDNYLNEDE